MDRKQISKVMQETKKRTSRRIKRIRSNFNIWKSS